MLDENRNEYLRKLSSFSILKLIEIQNKNEKDKKTRKLTEFEYEAWIRGLYGTRRDCVLTKRTFDKNSEKCKCCLASSVCFLYP